MAAPDGQRLVQVPAELMRDIGRALTNATRLSASHDALESVRVLADRPKPSELTALLGDVAHRIGVAQGEAPPVERADLHVFALEQLTPEFVNELLLARGWQQARIVVGSAHGEALARRLLAGAPTLAGKIKLVPLSAGHQLADPATWTLGESEAG